MFGSSQVPEEKINVERCECVCCIIERSSNAKIKIPYRALAVRSLASL